MFSHGIIDTNHWGGVKHVNIKFSSKGKTWNTEKALKAHLAKAVMNGINTGSWEIVEVLYKPTKPIDEWIDPKMLMVILKNSS